MDEADQAQRHEEAERAAALEAWRYRVLEDQWIVDGVVLCLDCAAPVPATRLAAAPWAVRCVACQEQVERGDRL